MNYSIFVITTFGFIVGILGTGIGGVLALSLVSPNKRLLSLLIGVTSGIMLSVVTFELLPESYLIGGLIPQVIGILIGIVLIIFIENNFPISHSNVNLPSKNDFLRTGIIMGLGIAIHNLPEGMAIGSGFVFTAEVGMKVAIVTILHNVPEGIAMATPLRVSGFSKLKVVSLTILSGIPTGIGAFIGALLGNFSDSFIALCLAFAGGTMLYITCGELIPHSKNIYKGRTSTIGLVIGFIIGLIVINKV